MSDLFADVKVGDVFFTKNRSGFLILHKVSRVSSARFFEETKGYENCYRKSDGMMVGGNTWRGDSRTFALMATNGLIAERNKQRLIVRAEFILGRVSKRLADTKGDEAIRLAALLPPELKGDANV